MEILALIMGLLLIVLYFALMGLAIASYIMQSLALYTISREQGNDKAWLAWLPVGSDWVLGKIADAIDHEEGKNRNWSKVLFVLSLIVLAGVFVFFAFYGVMLGSIFLMSDMAGGAVLPEGMYGGMLALFCVVYIVVIIMALASTALMICQYIGFYRIFERFAPKKAVKYLLVSILVPLGLQVCLMKCKNAMIAEKSAYMPPVDGENTMI